MIAPDIGLESILMTLQILESVPSTMDAARENILLGRVSFDRSGQPDPVGVLARVQTAGRGQRGNAWFASPGESLSATYYFRWDRTDPQYAAEIAFLAGVAVVEALRFPGGLLPQTADERNPDVGPQQEPAFGLKWPNDILLQGKKLGGILIEMVRAPDHRWVALIGTGINLTVRDFPPELVSLATSLQREGLASPRIEDLANRIAVSLCAWADIRDRSGFKAILAAWRRYDQTPGRRYQANWEGRLLQGIAEGVNDSGALKLRLESGSILAVTSASSLRELPE
jgi:BirA family biotin operon repressor/biotin-[acetyl-CoA-carboxylase] ligase